MRLQSADELTCDANGRMHSCRTAARRCAAGKRKPRARASWSENVFGEPAGYEKLSDREARFAAICLGYSNFHFSRLLSGSECTIALRLPPRQLADGLLHLPCAGHSKFVLVSDQPSRRVAPVPGNVLFGPVRRSNAAGFVFGVEFELVVEPLRCQPLTGKLWDDLGRETLHRSTQIFLRQTAEIHVYPEMGHTVLLLHQ